MPDPRAPGTADTTAPVRPAPELGDPVDLDGLAPAPLPPPDQSLPVDEDEPWRPPGEDDPAPDPGGGPDIDDGPHTDPGDVTYVDDDGPHTDPGGVFYGDGDGSPDVGWDLAAPDPAAYGGLTEADDGGITRLDDDPD
jgi:hypothetical protein